MPSCPCGFGLVWLFTFGVLLTGDSLQRRAVRLKGSTFLQSPESPGFALDFRKVELEQELRLAGGRRFKNSCFVCAVGIWSAAGRGDPVVLLAMEGTYQLQGAQPGRGQMERDVLHEL
ncbi:hypothetical protein HGM15179_005108 [Zosterops borbonicus]|uniref:Uncharacterized protein n=1 Tax=Zosterops borbonicus TaxID=364589 RepID=A0A8K1LPJ9_9PASS|nr:hypothetical protein HGM15179_005108 [Zosterops borbonicus]